MNPLDKLPLPLLEWFRDNARSLPWRDDPTPYHVWLSEIMLQQTRVAAVLDYYKRFLEEAPDVPALAALPEDRLMKLWQGLGYYSRARNLQKAAKVIVERYGGQFPADYAPARGGGLHRRGRLLHCLWAGRPRRGRQRTAGICPDHGGWRGHYHPSNEEKSDTGAGGDYPCELGGDVQPGADGAGGHGLPAKRRAAV